MNARIFAITNGKRYLAVNPDNRLVKAFTARTPDGILRYYAFDGEVWRKDVIVLVRQTDGLYRVYYRQRNHDGYLLVQRLADLWKRRPVRIIPESDLPRLLEPEHIRQLKEAERWMLDIPPAADVTV